MLLADFHVHTTWSDGKLPMADVVDLFGRSGHDVIAITDHVVNRESLIGKTTNRFELTLNETNFERYLDEIRHQAHRALVEYDMLVLPGIELSHNTYTRKRAAHVLALGVDHFISADGTVEEMLLRAQQEARVVVACHPHEQSDWFANTFYLWNRREEVAHLIDLWEVGCRWDLFAPVSRAKVRYIANSDFHDVPHLYAWKTLLRCEKSPEIILSSLKTGESISAITRLEPRLNNSPTAFVQHRQIW